jgi:NAD-dependent deacetylase
VIDEARGLVARAKRIVAFSGAGLSAESGVPTFRDAATGGFWTKYDPTRLASPQGFADDPETVIAWYNARRVDVRRAEPNPAHRTLAAHDVLNVTQNVDDLLHRAGATRIVSLHGTLTADRCNAPGCGHRETIDMADPPPMRPCPECGTSMRPDVVWFGEMLPERAWDEATHACAACDLMLVIGTAAEVYPAAGLIDVARSAGARTIVVNTQSSGAGAGADAELIGPAGVVVPELFGD